MSFWDHFSTLMLKSSRNFLWEPSRSFWLQVNLVQARSELFGSKLSLSKLRGATPYLMGLAPASSFTSKYAVILICYLVALILQSVTTNWGGQLSHCHIISVLLRASKWQDQCGNITRRIGKNIHWL